MQTFARLLQRWKLPLILLLVLVTAAGVWLSLGVRLEVQAETLLDTEDDEGLAALRRYESLFPSDEGRFLVGLGLERRLDEGGEAVVTTVAGALRDVPGIARVVTPRDAVGGRDPTVSRSLEGLLLSNDHRTAALVCFLDPAHNTTPGRDRIFRQVHAILDGHLPRDDYAIVGTPFYRREFIRFIGEDQLLFIPITLVLLLGLLTLLFRRPLAVALPFLAVFMAVAWTGGVLGWMQRPITMLTGALPTLLIAIGVTVAIHVIYRYREERLRGGDPAEIARRTVATVGLPCLLSTVTTMVGFGSLVLARVADIREFGLLAAAGVGFAFVVCIVLIPYVLPLERGGRAAPRREDEEEECVPGAEPAATDRLGRMLAAGCRLARRRPAAMVVGALLLLGVATVGVVQVDMDAYLTDDMGSRTFIFHSYQFFEQRLSSMIPLDIVIESGSPGGLLDPAGRRATAKLQAFLAARPEVEKTLSALDIVADFQRYRPLATRLFGIGRQTAAAAVPGAQHVIPPVAHALEEMGGLEAFRRNWPLTARVLGLGGKKPLLAALERVNRQAPVGALTDATGTVGRIVVLLKDVGARRSFALYEAVHEFARTELPSDVRVSEAGVSVLANRVIMAVITEGMRSFVLAFVVIFAVVSVLFRSLRTGLLCLLGTLVPIYVGVGAMGMLGIVIRTSTVIVGSIALGLAIDLTIHLLGRYRRECARGRSRDEALGLAMVETGKPIVVSAGILVIGFGILGLSRFGLTSEFGIVAAITILTALVTTLVMLPALLKLGVLGSRRDPG